MASPNLVTDCTATVQFGTTIKDVFSSHVLRFEDKTSVSWQEATAKLRTFALKYANQTAAMRASFSAFFDARGASRDQFYFNWLPTAETDIKVKFLENEVDYSFDNVGIASWAVTLIEVL